MHVDSGILIWQIENNALKLDQFVSDLEESWRNYDEPKIWINFETTLKSLHSLLIAILLIQLVTTIIINISEIRL